MSLAVSQPAMTVEEYIGKYSDLAVEEMKKYKIPASITLAQGLLESGSGNSELARNANNHFGIKCQKGWTGKTYTMDDDEKDECFRRYDSPEDSYRDHSVFLTTRDRYALLLELDIRDYKGWAQGLKQAGYATNPRYPELLIKIVEENELYRFDNGVKAGEKPADGHQKPSGKKDDVILSDAQHHEGTPGVVPAEAIPFGKWESGREMFFNNKVIFVYARPGDTWQGLAAEFGIYGWQVRKYNELTPKQQPQPGDIVYLEHKRSQASKGFHDVLPGETLNAISQRYAVKPGSLARMNGLQKGEDPVPGKGILLRKSGRRIE
jgi:hypothetical protein